MSRRVVVSRDGFGVVQVDGQKAGCVLCMDRDPLWRYAPPPNGWGRWSAYRWPAGVVTYRGGESFATRREAVAWVVAGVETA